MPSIYSYQLSFVMDMPQLLWVIAYTHLPKVVEWEGVGPTIHLRYIPAVPYIPGSLHTVV